MDPIIADPRRTLRMNSDTYYRRMGLKKVQMNETPIIFLYNPSTHSDLMNKFFEVMKKEKMCTLSAQAQQAKSYLTATEIGSYEELGEVYDREKLGLRPDDPVFMKHEVPEKFEFGKPFLTSVELSKRHFPVGRLHNWYKIVSSLGVTNITFQIPGNAFYSGARLGSI
jgi:hypothetical protein